MPIYSFPKKTVSVLFCLLIASCSSKPELPETQAFFNHNILENDSKMFNFNLLLKRRTGDDTDGQNAKGSKGKQSGKKPKDGQRPSNGERSGKGKKGEGNRPKGSNGSNQSNANIAQQRNNERLLQLEQMLFEQLDDKMQETGYCREGYMVLSQELGKNILSVKGECHESATSEDRAKFINQ